MEQNQDKDKITFNEGYWSNGQLWFKHQLLNGLKHGEQLRYYPNGQLSHKHQFLNGKEHGEELSYWDNGKLMYKDQYLNGKRNGEQLSYYSNDQLRYKNYYINGEWTSYEEWIKYNRNSKLQSIWNKIKIK